MTITSRKCIGAVAVTMALVAMHPDTMAEGVRIVPRHRRTALDGDDPTATTAIDHVVAARAAFRMLQQELASSDLPSDEPSGAPSDAPSSVPSDVPSSLPSDVPSTLPSDVPSNLPSDYPSSIPSDVPSNMPSDIPSNMPSDLPSNLPSDIPSTLPSQTPSGLTGTTNTFPPSDMPSNIPPNWSTPSPTAAVSKELTAEDLAVMKWCEQSIITWYMCDGFGVM